MLLQVQDVVLSLVVIGVLDALWIGSNLPRYRAMYSAVQQGDMKVRLSGALVAYAFVLLTFVAVALPFARQNMRGSIARGAAFAGLVGFGAYGIYNATNYAIFARYSPAIGVLDTLWGGALFALTAAVVLSLTSKKT